MQWPLPWSLLLIVHFLLRKSQEAATATGTQVDEPVFLNVAAKMSRERAYIEQAAYRTFQHITTL